jgi:hypothetical protein
MLEPLFDFLERLISQFTWRRLAFVIVLVVAATTVVVAFESYTAKFRLAKLEQTIKLVQLAEHSKFATTPDVQQHLTSTLANSAKELDLLSSGNATAFSLPSAWLKGLAAFAPWTLLLIIFPLVAGGGTKQAIAAVFILALPLSVLGALLPDFAYAWINYIGYPVFSFAVVVFLVVIRHRVKQSRARAAS